MTIDSFRESSKHILLPVGRCNKSLYGHDHEDRYPIDIKTNVSCTNDELFAYCNLTSNGRLTRVCREIQNRLKVKLNFKHPICNQLFQHGDILLTWLFNWLSPFTVNWLNLTQNVQLNVFLHNLVEMNKWSFKSNMEFYKLFWLKMIRRNSLLAFEKNLAREDKNAIICYKSQLVYPQWSHRENLGEI